MREYKVYLNDIIRSIEKIERYTKDLTYGNFQNNDLVVDAVIRNLEIIGEASKSISPEVRK